MKTNEYNVTINGRTVTVTSAQLRELRDEAARAGDEAQELLCIRALEGNESAQIECAEVIAAAQAMVD